MNEASSEHGRSSRLQQWSRLFAWFLGGITLGLIGVGVAWRIKSEKDRMPPLASDDWQQARDRWTSADVKNYDVEVVVTGRQAATYAVQVRDGQVFNATRDGQALPQKRTWSTWTVDGMFETIARDLDSVERHAQGRAVPGTPNLQLRALFDPQLGYPQRYLRTEMVRLGTNPEVSWRVTRFEKQ